MLEKSNQIIWIVWENALFLHRFSAMERYFIWLKRMIRKPEIHAVFLS